MPTFERDGVTLHYEVSGDTDSPAVILLHGFTCDHRAWRQLSEVLATGFHVIAPDLRGHGASDAPKDLDTYTMEAYANDLSGLLNHLDVDTAALVGCSFGGMIALEYSVQYPQTLSALVLTDTPPAYEHPKYGEAFRRREAGISQNEDMAARMGMEAMAKLAAEHIKDPFLADSIRNRYLNISREGFLGAAKTRRERRDVSGLLKAQLAMPVLLCAGQDDPVFSALDVMADELPDARVVEFEDCGHGVPFIKPGEFSAVLGEFLGDVQAGNQIARRSTA